MLIIINVEVSTISINMNSCEYDAKGIDNVFENTAQFYERELFSVLEFQQFL